MDSGLHLRRLKWYLDYRFSARTIQYIHSPFLFSLMQTVFRDDRNDEIFTPMENLRREFLSDNTPLEIKDMGAGSHTAGNTIHRTVNSIARTALLRPAYARFLYRLIRHVQAKQAIEMGTSLGITSQYIAAAAGQEGRLVTMEGSAAIANVARKGFEKNGFGNISVAEGNFDDTFPAVLADTSRIDFLFIDGNHRKEPTLRYFREALPYLHGQSVVVLDDIYWSEEMLSAWQEIYQRPEITLSFDVFRFGVLFFNPALSKEHFRLRY
jgi:predicted O-methyltransferase YrrM